MNKTYTIHYTDVDGNEGTVDYSDYYEAEHDLRYMQDGIPFEYQDVYMTEEGEEDLDEDYNEPYSMEFEEYFNKGNNEDLNKLVDELGFDYNNFSESEKKDLYQVWKGIISKDEYKKHRQWDKELKEDYSPEEKVDLWHRGTREVNVKACSEIKLRNYRRIATNRHYDDVIRKIDRELNRRHIPVNVVDGPADNQTSTTTHEIPSIFSFHESKDLDLLNEFEEQYTSGKLTAAEYKSLLEELKDELNEDNLEETYSQEELDAMVNKTYNQQKILNIYRRNKYNDKRLFAHTRCVDCGREKRVFLSNLINDPEKYGSCVCSDTNVDARLDNINALYSGEKKLSSNTSGYTGVSYVKNYSGELYDKWRAYIDIDGHRHFLGDFDSKSEAVRARKEAAEKGIKWYKDHKNEFMRDTRKKQKRYRTKSYKAKNKAKGTKI